MSDKYFENMHELKEFATNFLKEVVEDINDKIEYVIITARNGESYLEFESSKPDGPCYGTIVSVSEELYLDLINLEDKIKITI